MNLAESVKYILKNKSQHFITELWREDLKVIAKDIFHGLGPHSVKSLKKSGLKINARELLESAADTVLIIKVLPGRIRRGYSLFKDDFIIELEKLPDQKQKTIFCLKVFGAVSRFTLGAVYDLKVGKTDFVMVGLRRRNAFTQFIVAELVFKISQRMMQKFLNELEQLVEDKSDLGHIIYFKELISDRRRVEEVIENTTVLPSDPAIELVEGLKNYIMKGHWNSSKLNHDRKNK